MGRGPPQNGRGRRSALTHRPAPAGLFFGVKAGAPWRGLPEAPHSRNPGACELPHVGGMPATALFVCPCPPYLDETMGT